MIKVAAPLLIVLILLAVTSPAEEDYLKIITQISPKILRQGEEGILKIKITPREGMRISSHPEMIIKLKDNNNLTFPKVFFTASELSFPIKQDNDTIILDLEKQIEIPFKVQENSLLGKHRINGEIIFTAVTSDNWSLKTYQKFFSEFVSRPNYKRNKAN